MRISLAKLATAGQLRPRDLDAIMIAYGRLNSEAIEAFLADRETDSDEDDEGDTVDRLTQEIVDRICACQVQDGGRTEIVSSDSDRVHLRAAGACVHCPQIVYTMGIVEVAIRHRLPQVATVVIDGTALDVARRKPENAQLTMPMVMRRTGMTFEDLDRELERKDSLTDEDIVRLARRCALRMQVRSTDDDV